MCEKHARTRFPMPDMRGRCILCRSREIIQIGIRFHLFKFTFDVGAKTGIIGRRDARVIIIAINDDDVLHDVLAATTAARTIWNGINSSIEL